MQRLENSLIQTPSIIFNNNFIKNRVYVLNLSNGNKCHLTLCNFKEKILKITSEKTWGYVAKNLSDLVLATEAFSGKKMHVFSSGIVLGNTFITSNNKKIFAFLGEDFSKELIEKEQEILTLAFELIVDTKDEEKNSFSTDTQNSPEQMKPLTSQSLNSLKETEEMNSVPEFVLNSLETQSLPEDLLNDSEDMLSDDECSELSNVEKPYSKEGVIKLVNGFFSKTPHITVKF